MKRILAGSAIFITIILLITGAYLRFSALVIKPTAAQNNGAAEIQKSVSTSASVVPAPGIFIIPPGGKEVDRDTTGKRAEYYNIGDGITILSDNPKALFLVNETISPIKTKKRGFSGKVSKLGEKNYLRFVNNGDKEERIEARITPR